MGAAEALEGYRTKVL